MVFYAKRMIRKVRHDSCAERITIPEFQRFQAMRLRLLFAVKFFDSDDSGNDDLMPVKGQLHFSLIIGNAHGLKPPGRESYLMCFAPAPAVPPAALLLIRANRLSMSSPPCILEYIIFGTNNQHLISANTVSIKNKKSILRQINID